DVPHDPNRGDEYSDPHDTRRDAPVPALAVASSQDALEGIRHRFEALDASPQQLSRVAQGVTSNASRSDERARCRRTRTLAGSMPTPRAAFPVPMSSQSTRISAAR